MTGFPSRLICRCLSIPCTAPALEEPTYRSPSRDVVQRLEVDPLVAYDELASLPDQRSELHTGTSPDKPLVKVDDAARVERRGILAPAGDGLVVGRGRGRVMDGCVRQGRDLRDRDTGKEDAASGGMGVSVGRGKCRAWKVHMRMYMADCDVFFIASNLSPCLHL